MEIIIEEISRGHKLLHRHKLFNKTINIGRSYQNDIILSDPHVCADHMQINFENDQWCIKDQNSINGTFLGDGKQNANQHIIEDGDIIYIGKSQLRFLFADHSVPPTIHFSPFENFINLMRQPLSLFLAIFVFTIIAGSTIYLNKPTEVNFSQLFVPAIGMTLLFALWPSCVALISQLSKHEARVMAQLGISFTFFNLMWLSDIFENIIIFNSSSSFILPALVALLPITLSFCLFWLNGYIGFHMSAKRRMVIASSITLIIFGGSYLIEYSNKPDFSINPQYNSTIMTPSFLFTSSNNVEGFIKDSEALFTKVQEKAMSKK